MIYDLQEGARNIARARNNKSPGVSKFLNPGLQRQKSYVQQSDFNYDPILKDLDKRPLRNNQSVEDII